MTLAWLSPRTSVDILNARFAAKQAEEMWPHLQHHPLQMARHQQQHQGQQHQGQQQQPPRQNPSHPWHWNCNATERISRILVVLGPSVWHNPAPAQPPPHGKPTCRVCGEGAAQVQHTSADKSRRRRKGTELTCTSSCSGGLLHRRRAPGLRPQRLGIFRADLSAQALGGLRGCRPQSLGALTALRASPSVAALHVDANLAGGRACIPAV